MKTDLFHHIAIAGTMVYHPRSAEVNESTCLVRTMIGWNYDRRIVECRRVRGSRAVHRRVRCEPGT
jgi:hypothetical protein